MKKPPTVFRLTLPSNPKYIGRVETFLKKVSRTTHFDEIQLHKMMVALTEAVNNAMIHGNKLDAAKKVHIRLELVHGNPGGKHDWLVAVISDEGTGFKPEEIANPLKKQNLMKESGRGIFLMKTLMDKVLLIPGKHGTQVELWMDLQKDPLT